MDVSYQFRLAAERLDFAFRHLKSGDNCWDELQGVVGHLRKSADQCFVKAYEHREMPAIQQTSQPDIPVWKDEIQGQIQRRLDALSQLGIEVEWL